MDVILVLNAGSSSLKFQIFALGPTGLERQVKDQIDGLAFSLRAVGHRAWGVAAFSSAMAIGPEGFALWTAE